MRESDKVMCPAVSLSLSLSMAGESVELKHAMPTGFIF